MKMEYFKQEDRLNGVNPEESNVKKGGIFSEIQRLKERINEGSDNSLVERLVSLLESAKDLERHESEVLSCCIVEYSIMLAEFNELEEMLQNSVSGKDLHDILDHYLHESNEILDEAKRELASKLRAILALRRQLDALPIPAELIQYELRLSELYANIQKKLQQTRKYYDTYNALVVVKELMLKETSLLNSISSQLQNAINSPVGRTKLLDSMDGVLQGIQQKQERIQLSLESEKQVCAVLKDKYRKSLSEQRNCYALLKNFQEECLRNQRLRDQISMVDDVEVHAVHSSELRV